MVGILTILLFVLVPSSFVAGGFIAYKGVQLGLRWQIQTTQQKPPEMKMPNPIAPIVEAKQEKQETVQDKVQSILDEWVNGPQESR